MHYFAYYTVCCAGFEEDLENCQNLSLQWSDSALFTFKKITLLHEGMASKLFMGGTCWESVIVLQVRDFDGLEECGTVEMDTCK